VPSSPFKFGSWFISSDLIPCRLTWPRLISSHLISSNLISSHFIWSNIFSLHLTSHLISSHLIQSHFIWCRVFFLIFSYNLISSSFTSSLLYFSAHPSSSRLISITLSCSHVISACLISSHVISITFTSFSSYHFFSFERISWSRCALCSALFPYSFQSSHHYSQSFHSCAYVEFFWLPIESLSPTRRHSSFFLCRLQEFQQEVGFLPIGYLPKRIS